MSKQPSIDSRGGAWLYVAGAGVIGASLLTAFLLQPRGLFSAGEAWTRLGAAITDSAGAAEPSVLVEGNPQVLTNCSTVFKMWYRSGEGTVNYEESADGVSWTPYARNPVLGGGHHACPFVLKVGGTYYLYAHDGISTDWSYFNRWNSTDGLTWALDADHCLVGGAGAWDEVLGNPCVWVEGSIWYMLYEVSLFVKRA